MENTVVWSCKRFDELSTHDLYAILQLRAEIFVVEQDCVYQDVDGFDQGALHVMGHLAAAEEAGASQLVCYTRLLAPGVKYEGASVGRVVTRKSARGGGLGKTLMLQSLAFSRAALARDGNHYIGTTVFTEVLYRAGVRDAIGALR